MVIFIICLVVLYIGYRNIVWNKMYNTWSLFVEDKYMKDEINHYIRIEMLNDFKYNIFTVLNPFNNSASNFLTKYK